MTGRDWQIIVARIRHSGYDMPQINAAWQRARALGTSRDDPAEVVEAAVRKELEATP